MANELIGVAELHAKLKRGASPAQNARALRASVADPMRIVRRVALSNLSRISPGKRQDHRTYLNRIVTAGFAARSVVVRASLNRAKTAAFAKLGVKREAFYAINFFELGTATLGKQPWLVPAFESQRSAALAGVTASLRKSVLKMAKGTT